MELKTIEIEVDAETARAYFGASAAEQRKLQQLLALRLKDLMSEDRRSLLDIMDEIGSYAESQGMTPNVLQSLLKD